jgi:uncharacterized protein
MATDRLALVRDRIDHILRQIAEWEYQRAGTIHLYGVSAVCVLLAVRRGLDPELCAIIGMLHDIRTYRTGDHIDHARLGAPEAETILEELGCFTPEEIAVVGCAIARHSDKEACDEAMDELLKDADVLQHFLYNPGIADGLFGPGGEVPAEAAAWVRRWRSALNELGAEPSSRWPALSDAPPRKWTRRRAKIV